MNMEELKLVTDTIQQLGEHGTTAFIWWIVFDKLVPAVLWTVGSCAFMYLCWRVTLVCVATNKAVNCMYILRRAFGLGGGYLVPSEIDRVMERALELQRKEKENAR